MQITVNTVIYSDVNTKVSEGNFQGTTHVLPCTSTLKQVTPVSQTKRPAFCAATITTGRPFASRSDALCGAP